MAKLGKPYPFPAITIDGDFQAELKAQEDALAAIPVDKLYYQSWADSAAYYYVESLEPLVLRPIPYCDAWELPYAYIRGLRKKDVLQKIEFEKIWRKDK